MQSSPFVPESSNLKLLVLEELHRAYDSGLDGVSDRQRALLTYLVTEEVEGRGDRIKAYSIATEIFGRPADFDPQQDSIVRVEIGRLRQALERYYLTAGRDDPVVISIPKGQYRPVFTPAQPPAPAAPQAKPPGQAPAKPRGRVALIGAIAVLIAALGGLMVWKYAAPRPSPPAFGARGPVVAIPPFEIHADKDGQDYIAGGLQLDLADVLSDYNWLTVVPLNENVSSGDDAGPKPDFLVRGSLRLIGDDVKATVLLLDGATGAVRWTNRYEFPLNSGEVRSMQRDLVTKIGRDVGNPFGIVADIERAKRAMDDSRTDEAFACHLRAMQYWRNFHSKDYAPAWRCFAALPASAGADAATLAMRAILTLDPLNMALTHRSFADARAEALTLSTRAMDINALDFLPRAARYMAALCVSDTETFRHIARETAERFPKNPIALADIGARMITGSGETQEGLALIAKARDLARELTPVDTVAVAVDALRRGEYAPRPRLSRFVAQTDDPFVLIAELALAAARQDADTMTRVRQKLADAGFPDQKRLSQVLETTCWSQDLRDLVNAKITLAFKDASKK